nr:hypothetical protein [Streptomyces sp. SID2999]
MLTALAVLTLTIPLSAAALWSTTDAPETQATDAHWAKDVTPEWMSAHMDLELPDSAHSAKAAYDTTSRFDTGLLTFTLTRAEAKQFLKGHPPEGKWLTPSPYQPTPPDHDFTHLGLAEPESLRTGTRYGDICPTANECVSLWAHDYAPTRTRIYVRAHYEPGISPTALLTIFSSSAHTSARSSRALFFGSACSTTSRCSRKP